MEKKYWFINKKVGIGWTPVTWEGWSVTGLYVLALGFVVYTTEPGKEIILSVLGLTFLLLAVVYLYGEPLDWRFWKKK